MKHLVIVESPTKAKTISRFLGKDYTIKFSMGHIMDLPKSKLGVDIADNFTPQYEVVADKKKLISELKSAAKSADTILLATDPDREGEAISANIRELLEEKSKGKSQKAKVQQDSKFKRIVFHEITEGAIREALEHPRNIDTHLVDAQTARRVLDRLVGYQLSPVLWKKVRRGLSAGRVQSVALRLIVEREREIEKFVKEPYWTIHALLVPQAKEQKGKLAVEFSLIEINGKKVETSQAFSLYDGEYKVTKTVIDTKEKAQEVVSHLQGGIFTVADVAKRQIKRSPAAPFTTSTLQQEAARRFGFSGKRTMSLAQKLYEEGFITYHRTDSVTLSQVAISQIRGYIGKEFGERYLAGAPRVYSAKQKLAQEAHEGIRPTKVTTSDSVIAAELEKDHAKLYDLIWRRAVASQMADALLESTAVYVDAKTSEQVYRFKANGSVLVFDGFLRLNPQALSDTQLPAYTVGEVVDATKIRDESHETLPPPRYNDASIISTLEEKGIGRPSTYASIISTLVDRTYVERVEKKFIPTSIGIAVNDFLVANFSTIDDIPFTVTMEDDLDAVANGKKEWVEMMREFYSPFEKKLAEVGDAARVKIETEETNEKCPVCGNPLVIRHGKFGKFFACSTFPACNFTKQYVEETGVTCPKDGGRIIVKKTKKGIKFFGCSNYPKCTFAAWKLEDVK
jgi:DNA topoisomerase-1